MDATQPALDQFFARLENASDSLLLLDYDGTLAPFHPDRLKAGPADGIREALDEILALSHSRVVIVSGRPCEEVLRLLRPAKPIMVWGCHGREFRDLDGNIQIHGVTPGKERALHQAAERIRHLTAPERIDLKTGCLALHWRGLGREETARIEKEARNIWREYVERESLSITTFDGGIELYIPGRTKGDAVDALLDDIDTTRTAVAFLGDDLTDEDGFAALGDRGLSVLVRNEPRDTAAHVRITMPEGVLDFLGRWRDASRKGVTS